MIPKPEHKDDQKRWEIQGRALRMLTGEWKLDAENRLASFFHVSIRQQLPAPDTSHNAFLSITSQKSILYDDPPVITADAKPEDIALLAPPEFWGVVQRAAFLTDGIGEHLVRIDLDRDAADRVVGLTWRDVPASAVVLRTRRGDDTQPVRVEELRERITLEGETVWAWEVWDVTNPADPKWRIEIVGKDGVRMDSTAKFLPEAPAYPYFDRAGVPILPYVLRHATVHAGLWDYASRAELVDGTLTASALWTLWLLGMRDGSTPVRFLFNGRMLAAEVRAPDGALGATVQAIVANPMQIHQVIDDNGSARIDQLPPAVNPTDQAAAIEMYEAGLAQYAGINAADVQRGSTGQSGYAIVVSRDGLRRAQKRMIPSARIADRLLLATGARLLNAYMTTELPESHTAYTLRYADVSRTPDEIKAQTESALVQIAAGMLHPGDAYAHLNPGTDREAAMVAMVENIEARKMLEAVAAAPAPTATPDTAGASDLLAMLADAIRTGDDPREIVEDLAEMLGVDVPEMPDDEPTAEEPMPDATPAADAPAPDGVVTEATAETAAVQAVALNGAQVQAAQGIVQAAAEGQLPRESAKAMLSLFFGLSETDAENILGSVGRTFTPAAPVE